MTLNEWQGTVRGWIENHGGYFAPQANLLRLVEEVGELSRAVNIAHGPKRPKPGDVSVAAEEEIGDCLFVLACLADQLGLDLEAIAVSTMRKMATR